jgi:CubicO group peptidase (beta-lactamase class C family)
MTTTTSGWMASMTKLMTSVAAMQVVEKGLVGLDDDLGAILPELGDRKILMSFDEETKTASFMKPTNKITMR